MDALITFWKAILIFAFVAFIPFVLILTVLGARDLRTMLKGLKDESRNPRREL